MRGERHPKTPKDVWGLDPLIAAAEEALKQVDGDLCRLGEPHQTILTIVYSKGVIDNGGLRYFFEKDWPQSPPYSLFADAYERIGRRDAADSISEAARSFGMEHPERYAQKRNSYMEMHLDETAGSVRGWVDCICGDDEIWARLTRWAQEFHGS